MNKLLKCFLCLFLLAAPAHAEFTSQEKAEVLRLIEVARLQAQAANMLTYQLGATPEIATDVQAALEDLLGNFAGARRDVIKGFGYLADIDPFNNTDPLFPANLPRSEVVQLAFEQIAKASSNHDRARLHIQSALDHPSCTGGCGLVATALDLVDDADVLIAGFDTTLPYTEPRLDTNLAFAQLFTDNPRLESAVAGPHGDYRVIGFELVSTVDEYTIRAWLDMMKVAITQPSLANRARQFGAAMWDVLRWNGEVLGLLVGAEVPSLVDDIDLMASLGTTDRDRSFWQVAMMFELLTTRAPNGGDVFGRSPEGMPKAWKTACIAFEGLILADPGASAESKIAADAMEHMCDAWAAADHAAWSIQKFKHSLNTGRPGGAPPPADVVCGPGTFLDESTTPAQCLPDPVTPPECPTFAAHLVLVDEVTAQAHCVEVP